MSIYDWPIYDGLELKRLAALFEENAACEWDFGGLNSYVAKEYAEANESLGAVLASNGGSALHAILLVLGVGPISI